MNNRLLQLTGVVALERFCAHERIHHPSIDELVDHLWSFAFSNNLPDWERRGANLALTGRGDPPPPGLVEACPSAVWIPFWKIVQEVVEIGIVDMYAADSQRPRQYARSVVTLVEVHGVVLSDLALLRSAMVGGRGFGDPIDRELVDEWRARLSRGDKEG